MINYGPFLQVVIAKHMYTDGYVSIIIMVHCLKVRRELVITESQGQPSPPPQKKKNIKKDKMKDRKETRGKRRVERKKSNNVKIPWVFSIFSAS